jgi:hypothetical protein
MTTSITQQHIIEIHRLNHSLGEFVRTGLRDRGRRDEASISLLMSTVAMNWMDQIDNQSRFTPRTKRSKREDSPNAAPAELAYELYAKFLSTHYMDCILDHPPATLGDLSESKQAAVVASLGRSYDALPTLTVIDDVGRAWCQACLNSRRAYQRVGALFYLASQLPRHLNGVERERIDAEINGAMTILFRGAAAFEATEMRFAIVLNGEALAHTRAKMLSRTFGPGISVIQYLQDNESLPGRYATETEQSFRDKIAEYVATTVV